MSRPDVNAIVASPRMAEVRSAVALASKPAEVNAARLKAEAMRNLIAKAVEAAGDEAEDLRALRREAEEVALNASLKLGALVPEPVEGAGRPGAGGKVASVATFAEAIGVSRGTARNLRALRDAHDQHTEEFTGIVERALVVGKPIPLGKLRGLLKAPVDPIPRTRTSKAVKAAIEARDICIEITSVVGETDRARRAAQAFIDGIKAPLEGLRFVLNGEG